MARGKFGKGRQAQSQQIDADAKAELLFMLEEEKMAGDLYEVLYQQTGNKVFANIARSEDNHFNALLKQAEKFGVDTDAFVFNPVGEFVNDEVQAMYDDLLAQASVSTTAALEVGRMIELTDIADLELASADVAGTSLARVYDNLQNASYNHLEAFDTALGY